MTSLHRSSTLAGIPKRSLPKRKTTSGGNSATLVMLAIRVASFSMAQSGREPTSAKNGSFVLDLA